MPEGLQVTKATKAEPDAPALAALVEAAMYRAELRAVEIDQSLNDNLDKTIEKSLEKLMQKKEIIFKKTGKKKKISQINVRPYIIEAKLEKQTGGSLVMRLLLKAGSRGGISPVFFLEQLALESVDEPLNAACWNLHRECLYYQKGDILQPLSERV